MAIHISRPHHLPPADAHALVSTLAEDLSSMLELRYAWEGDHLTFSRKGLKGRIELHDGEVHLHVKKSRLLPVSERWLRDRIEAELDRYLGAS